MAYPGKTLHDPQTGVRLTFIQTARDTAGRRFETGLVYPPRQGREGQQPHFHTLFDEQFEVLSGTAEYVLNGQKVPVQAGQRFSIPRNTPHLNPYNIGQDELRLRQWIELETPDRKTLEAFEDFAETSFGLAAEGKKPSFLQLAVLLHSLQPSSYAAGMPIPLQRAMFGALAGIGRMLGYSKRYARFAVPSEEYQAPTPGQANDYHFLDRWLIPAPIETAWHYIYHGEDYPRWWNSVYKKVTRIAPGDADGVGGRTEIVVSGALPYQLKMSITSTLVQKPYRMEVKAEGDLVGRGIWRLRSVPGGTEVTYDWKVRATYPLIQALSPVLKPVFEYNHTWCMTHGESDLLKELAIASPVRTKAQGS